MNVPDCSKSRRGRRTDRIDEATVSGIENVNWVQHVRGRAISGGEEALIGADEEFMPERTRLEVEDQIGEDIVIR